MPARVEVHHGRHLTLCSAGFRGFHAGVRNSSPPIAPPATPLPRSWLAAIRELIGEKLKEVLLHATAAHPAHLVLARRRKEWDIPDPKQLPPDQFRAARDQIEKQVKELLRNG